MSYPTSNPTAKHELLTPKLEDDSLLDSFGFHSTNELFRTLQSDAPSGLKKLADVYSYTDSPEPKLSRSFLVIGVIRKSLVKSLESSFHSCTITVKRADHPLPEKDKLNSKAFSYFMRRLHQEDLVAILGLDKYQRFALLVPSTELETSTTTKADFVATCHVGKLSRAQEIMETNDDNEVADGLWQPPAEGLWQPPTTTTTNEEFTSVFTSNFQENSNKRKREDEQEEETFHKDKSAAAADRVYGEDLTRNLESRYKSVIYHMRAFNNWVKATQISELDPKSCRGPLRILDLACGKGGDLGKWLMHSRGIARYVGSDVARGSLRDAAKRARDRRKQLKGKCIFTCADLGSDVPGRVRSSKQKYPQKLLTWSLENEPPAESGTPEFKMIRGGGIQTNEKFDVISIQFAIHYMMSEKKRARRFFKTVGELLDIGGDLIITTTDARVLVGHLMNTGVDFHETIENPVALEIGGGHCRIEFAPKVAERVLSSVGSDRNDADDLFGLEYHFTLSDGDDEEGGGKAVNLPEWLTPIPLLRSLAKEAGLELESYQNFHEFYKTRSDPTKNNTAFTSLYNMNVLNQEGSISQNEWDISRLYCALRFRKVTDTKFLDEDEDEDAAEDENDLDIDDIDPEVKEKKFPIAFLKAKKNAGDAWGSLPDAEKTRLAEVELVKMLKG